MHMRRGTRVMAVVLALTFAAACGSDDPTINAASGGSASSTSSTAPAASPGGASPGAAVEPSGSGDPASTTKPAAASSGAEPSMGDTTLAPGIWGGDHAEMRVDDDGMRVEFDCAIGSVRGPLPVSSDGSFEWTGTYVTERGNPKVQGEPDARPATYRGTVAGDRMTLTADVPSFGITEDPYTLEKGARGYLAKCQ